MSRAPVCSLQGRWRANARNPEKHGVFYKTRPLRPSAACQIDNPTRKMWVTLRSRRTLRYWEENATAVRAGKRYGRGWKSCC